MNPLFHMMEDATWINDGSPDSSLVSPSCTLLEATSNQKGTPLNIMLQPNRESSTLTDDDSSHGCYFEVSISQLNGSLAVGVVKPQEFRPGFKIRGMLYNGGLTNGMVRLLVGFSDRPAAGDTVGVAVLNHQGKLQVTYYLNGRCLGTGFDLDIPINDNDDESKQQEQPQQAMPYLPCIQVDGKVICNYSAPKHVPSVLERQEAITKDNPHVGEWKMIKATRMRAFGGKDFCKFALPKTDSVFVKLSCTEKSKQEYDLEIKIINTFRTKLTVLPCSRDEEEKVDHVERVEVGHVSNTMMMPPLPLVSVENYIEKSLNGLYQLQIMGENLVLKCHAAEWICERHKRTFQPVKSYK